MGGSAKGKKAKRNSRSRKSGSGSKHSGTSTTDLDASHGKQETISEIEKVNDESLDTGINSSMEMSGCEKFVVHALKMLLYNKVNILYGQVLQFLVMKNVKIDKARYAILMNGHARGSKSFFKNIIDNSEKFLKSGEVTDKEAPYGCLNFKERVESLMSMLMGIKEGMCLYSNEIDALRKLLRLFETSGTSTASLCQNKWDPLLENPLPPKELEAFPFSAMPCDLVISNDLDWEDPDLLRLLEKETGDLTDVLILSALKQCRDLIIQLIETKTWAAEKVRQAGEKVVHHLLELGKLRTDKMENQQYKKNMRRLWQTDAALSKAVLEIEESIANVKHHELMNSEIRGNIEKVTLGTLNSNQILREVERRERKLLNKITGSEEENNLLREQVEEQKLKILQLKEEFLKLNKAEQGAKEKLAKEVKDKESAVALVAEEQLSKDIAEAVLRSKRVSLHQQAEITRKKLENDLDKLVDELAILQINEVAPCEEYTLHDTTDEYSDRNCILCSKNDASVLFLPCAHQILCAECNEKETELAWCPSCQVRVDEKISIFGAN